MGPLYLLGLCAVFLGISEGASPKWLLFGAVFAFLSLDELVLTPRRWRKEEENERSQSHQVDR
jgi:hypothetical protein